jgi:hydroxyacylglutathione hydrolase
VRIDFSTPDMPAYAAQISTASLGDHSYIVVVGSEAIAIDIQRDLDRFEGFLDGVDARLVAVLETHVHNDYVSGGKRLADAHGATYVLPANTGAPYDHRPISDGETVDVGSWLARAMHTPGHTHNHTSYVLESPSGPVAIFTGGSMLVGAVGRSDLLGADQTQGLLADQYVSVHRIASELPDPSIVAPTHGAGSFCSASDVGDTTSTIEREKAQNPALLAPSPEAFAMSQVVGYRAFPSYYRYMAPANLEPLGAPPTEPLEPLRSLDAIGDAVVVDVRPFSEYAAGHFPGSISIERSDETAVYVGWTLPWGSPVALVGSDEDAGAVRIELQRIGRDEVIGRIEPDRLGRFGVELATTEVSTFADIDRPGSTLLDVRDPVEHRNGVIPGSVAVHVAAFAADPGRFSTDRMVIHCQSGYRATIAAGFAEAAGATVTVITDDITNYRGDLVAPLEVAASIPGGV